VKFPDLIEPITRVGREIRMLEDFFLEGDATSHERILRDGKPDWDLDVVAGPHGALLFALDLDYRPDLEERVFKFGPPREATLRFRLQAYASKPVEVFRVDADGVTAIKYTTDGGRLQIQDRVSRVARYVAATRPGKRERVENRRNALVAEEEAHGFDPDRPQSGRQESQSRTRRRVVDSLRGHEMSSLFKMNECLKLVG